jgi:hypothetical protein
MRVPRPRDVPKTSAVLGASGGTAALVAILAALQKLDSRWIPYVSLFAFFVVTLLAIFFYLIIRRRVMPPHRVDPRRDAEHMRAASVFNAYEAAIARVSNRAIANLVIGTLLVVAGSSAVVYFLATRTGISGAIIIAVLTTISSAFNFFAYQSQELERRRLDAHRIHTLLLMDLAHPRPDDDYDQAARQELFAYMLRVSPVRE